MKPDPETAGTRTPITPSNDENAAVQSTAKQATTTPTKTSNLGEATEGQSPDEAHLSAARSRVLDSDATPSWRGSSDSNGRRRENMPQAAGYRTLRLLGSGTFGEVWLAEEESTGVQVAIKFLNVALSHQSQLLQDEVRQLALFHHVPGIVRLMDYVPDAPRPYFVMAFAEGGSLALRLKEGPMPLAEALETFWQIAEAMAYVHARGIRHCDLKPANILLDGRGRPLIADFGQAHLAQDMKPTLGTFFYMAPEQADLSERLPGSRWDVYGLGALFYAMVTGKPPYEDATIKQDLEKTEKLGSRLKLYREAMSRARPLTAHRKAPEMDSALANIIDRCLAVDPAKRYPTAEAIVSALKHRQRSRREKPILYAGLVLPLLLLLVLGLFGFFEARNAIQQSRADLEAQAKENFKVSSALAAAKVKRSVEDYLGPLVERAKSPELTEALQQPATGTIHDKVQAALGAFYDQLPKDKDVRGSCFVLNTDGTMIGIFPAQGGDEEFVFKKQSFAWRDYFHGEGDQLETVNAERAVKFRAAQKRMPIRRTHISDPYAAADRKKSLCLALSTPIFDGHKVVGVLVANLYVDQLNKWLREIEIPDGHAVLVDDRCHLLRHSYQHEKKWMPERTKMTPVIEEYKRFVDQSKRSSHSDQYVDPFENEEYLVGYTPIQFEVPGSRTELDRRWSILVQVKQESVVEPANKLRGQMLRWGGITVAVALILVVAMWLGLAWHIKREERLARA